VRFLGGHPDQALALAKEAQVWAAEVGRPFSEAQAHLGRAHIHLLRHETELAAAACAEALRIAVAYDMVYWALLATLLEAWVIGQGGDVGAARRRLEEGRGLAQMIGPRVCEAEYRGIRALLAAEDGGDGGDPSDRGEIESLEEMLRLVEEQQEKALLSELQRNYGELLLARGARRSGENTRDADAWLERALDTARRQGARSLELRAATVLLRHRRRLGPAEEERRWLEAAYASYDEGFDTMDLKLAAAELAAPHASR
jgi:adenylate cyclase